MRTCAPSATDIPVGPPKALWHMQSPKATRGLRKNCWEMLFLGHFKHTICCKVLSRHFCSVLRFARGGSLASVGILAWEVINRTPPKKLYFISVQRNYLWVVDYSWRSKSQCWRSPRNLASDKYVLRMLFQLLLNFTIKIPLVGSCGSSCRSLDILRLYFESWI